MTTNTLLIAISGVCSAIMCWAIIATTKRHGRFTLDLDVVSVHKYHHNPVPRVGGLALLVGLVCGGMLHGLELDQELYLAKWAGVAAIPVFLGGLLEDLKQEMSARERLLLAFFSATIAHYELNVGLDHIDWIWFDVTIMPIPGVTLLLTVIMVGGVAHAANIIDGFNGLLLGVAILTLLSFSWVAYQVDAFLLVTYFSIMLGATVGVFIFNFPFGRIFLGDGGAYLIGFFLAVFSLILVKNYSVVSPWFPLMVLAYPVTETLFSIFRKKFVSGKPAMVPDQYHLHMLVHIAMLRIRGTDSPKLLNSLTSIIMWIVYLIGAIPALIWWDRTSYLIFSLIGFICFYALVYIQLLKWTPALDVSVLEKV